MTDEPLTPITDPLLAMTMRVGMMNYVQAMSTDDLVELVHCAELARLEGTALLKRVDGVLKGESLRDWQLRRLTP